MKGRQRRFAQGDRVVDSTGFFGAGTFEQYDFLYHFALVTWDKRPPKEYNLGANPCVVEPETLEPEETDG
jgi:hypothetical protein